MINWKRPPNRCTMMIPSDVINNLPPRQRQVFDLRYKKNWKAKRVMSELGIAPSTYYEIIRTIKTKKYEYEERNELFHYDFPAIIRNYYATKKRNISKSQLPDSGGNTENVEQPADSREN